MFTFRLHEDISASSSSHSSAMSAISSVPVAGGEEGVGIVGISIRGPPCPLVSLPLALHSSVDSGATVPAAAGVDLLQVQLHLGGGVSFKEPPKGLYSGSPRGVSR